MCGVWLALLGAITVVISGCSRGSDLPAAAAATRRDSAGPADSVIARAREALKHGRAWTAATLMRPVVQDSGTSAPEASLLLARAAASWGGWDEVVSAISEAPWLDSAGGGLGHVLLVEAALARNDLEAARVHAHAALAAASGSDARSERLILLARVLARVSEVDPIFRDSAASAYARAASAEPRVADWLLLRAARLTLDDAERTRLLGQIADGPARKRVPLVEAQAFEAAGDSGRAMAAYAHAGRAVDALRLSLGKGMSGRRDSVRIQLLQVVRHGNAAEASRAIDVLDAEFARVPVVDERALAERAFALGRIDRASIGYQRILARGGTDSDRLAYATMLVRRGRDGDAVRQFTRVHGTADLRARALLGRARVALGRGEPGIARRALRALMRIAPEDTTEAEALYILADLATDEGRDEAAADAFREVVRRFPTSEYAPRALFRAGIISFVQHNARRAALEFDSLATRYPRSDDAIAGLYWAGRSWWTVGDTVRARKCWEQVRSRHALSYYSGLSARRLGGSLRPLLASVPHHPVPVWLATGLERLDVLDRVGLAPEAQAELDRLRQQADTSPLELLLLAQALEERGWYGVGIQVAWRAVARGIVPSVDLYRVLYPLPLDVRQLVQEAGARERVDPPLIAALIRQESAFNPRARSGADAHGLMQLLPSVARVLARATGVRPWRVQLLDIPEINVELGTSHLAAALQSHDDIGHTLAAYNAGDTRVARWSHKHGMSDPEVFVERIPFAETRDYVRIVERGSDMYGALYSW